jgi:hypothetical protein
LGFLPDEEDSRHSIFFLDFQAILTIRGARAAAVNLYA